MKVSALNVFWLVSTIVFTGCVGERGERQVAAAASGSEFAAALGDSQVEMAADAYMIVVTNRMPHKMIVYLRAGDNEMELGSVAANGSADFAITEPPVLEVELSATDTRHRHTVRGTVALSTVEAARWTIAPE